MTSLRSVAHQWRTDPDRDDIPEGVTVHPVDLESGHACSQRSGKVHIVADAARISDGEETRIVASWLCGGSSIDAIEVAHEPEIVCANCTLAAALPQRPCVYYAWGVGDELLYIGSTNQAMVRIRAHITSTPWWSEVRRLTFAEFDKVTEARRAESAAIWDRPSKYNRAGTKATSVRNLLGDVTVGEESA